MSSIAWTAIEKAIRAWVVAGSGLASSRVVWGGQNGPALEPPYIVLRRSRIRPVGNDWADTEDNPAPTAGAEILRKVRGQRRVVLTITCYGAAGVGPTSSEAILCDVIAALGLPSIGDALEAAGVGVSNLADVLVVDGVVDSTLLEPRASVDVFFYVASELVETGTYIEHVVIEDEVADPDEFFTVNP